MGVDIHLPVCGGVLKAENANCESKVKPGCYIFYIGIIDIPETQHRAGMMLVKKGTQCRQQPTQNLDLGMEEAELAL